MVQKYRSIKKQKISCRPIDPKLFGTIITDLKEKKSYTNIASLIEAIENIPDMKVYRKDFLHDICNALRDADRLGVSAAESIERNRNILRRKGRKIQGKVIGTTLLTKGLEFDTVVVLNAHRFNDKRHLYVALTRCCKQLIVISNNHILKCHFLYFFTNAIVRF